MTRLFVYEIYLSNCLDIPKFVQSIYSSALTDKSHECSTNGCELDSYCEGINIHVTETGYYTFTTNTTSIRGLFGYFYGNHFTLFSMPANTIERISVHSSNENRVSLHREMNSSFQLVVTTGSFLQGKFSINVQGPSKVIMKRIGMFS